MGGSAGSIFGGRGRAASWPGGESPMPSLRRFDRDGQTLGVELLGVEFGPFFMGDEQQGAARLVRLEHSQDGLFLLQGGEFEDRGGDVLHRVLVVVVEEDLVRR